MLFAWILAITGSSPSGSSASTSLSFAVISAERRFARYSAIASLYRRLREAPCRFANSSASRKRSSGIEIAVFTQGSYHGYTTRFALRSHQDVTVRAAPAGLRRAGLAAPVRRPAFPDPTGPLNFAPSGPEWAGP